MKHTVFSPFTDEELMAFADNSEGRTDLEIELGQRLQIALDMLRELEIEQALLTTMPPARQTMGGA